MGESTIRESRTVPLDAEIQPLRNRVENLISDYNALLKETKRYQGALEEIAGMKCRGGDIVTCLSAYKQESLWCAQCRARAALAAAPAAEAPVGRSRSALLRRVAELEEMVRVGNAVCLCGCGEHENLGEDGESCGDDAHFCLRVAPSVLSYVNGLRAALIAPAAEDGCVKAGRHVCGPLAEPPKPKFYERTYCPKCYGTGKVPKPCDDPNCRTVDCIAGGFALCPDCREF